MGRFVSRCYLYLAHVYIYIFFLYFYFCLPSSYVILSRLIFQSGLIYLHSSGPSYLNSFGLISSVQYYLKMILFDLIPTHFVSSYLASSCLHSSHLFSSHLVNLISTRLVSSYLHASGGSLLDSSGLVIQSALMNSNTLPPST